jgi:hypothetical protein
LFVDLRPLLIGLVTIVVIVLGVVGGGLRHRFRLAHPRWAATTDSLADRLVGVLIALVGVAVALAIVAPGPSEATTGVRLVAGGAAVGLLTGIPFVAERRQARRRLRDAAPPREPLPLPVVDGETDAEMAAREVLPRDPAAALEALGELDADAPRLADLRIRAAAAALLGDARLARACALRGLQLDRSRVDDLAGVGLLLARAGHFRDGVRLIERAVDEAPDALQPRLALVEALRVSGRLREAVSALAHRQPAGRATREG